MVTAGTAAGPVAPTDRRTVPAHQGPLDGLRAAAAAAVLLTHVGSLTGYSLTGTPVSWVLSRGDVGVPIFFTLSGLLLYRKWAAAALTGDRAAREALSLPPRPLPTSPAGGAVFRTPVLGHNAAPPQHPGAWLRY